MDFCHLGPARGTADLLVAALGLHDAGTADHCRRVARYAARLGISCRPMMDHELRALTLGAYLHDIGKLGVPQSILTAPREPTDEEWLLLRAHPEAGGELVMLDTELQAALPVILGHHERWDGRGYPRGRAGTDIPWAARVVAVADTLDVITHERPYKPAQTWERARQIIADGRGTQFDPAVVTACLCVPIWEWEAH